MLSVYRDFDQCVSFRNVTFWLNFVIFNIVKCKVTVNYRSPSCCFSKTAELFV